MAYGPMSFNCPLKNYGGMHLQSCLYSARLWAKVEIRQKGSSNLKKLTWAISVKGLYKWTGPYHHFYYLYMNSREEDYNHTAWICLNMPLSDCYISKRRGHERPQGNLDAAYVALQLGDEVSINMKHQPPPAIAWPWLYNHSLPLPLICLESNK